MLDEYEDAELGVGTWLNGESVYLVDGVADGAYPKTGGVVLLVRESCGWELCMKDSS